MSFQGLLNVLCTIQKRSRAQNATTGEWVYTWTAHASNVPCRLDMASGGEKRSANDILLRATHKLFLKYRTDLNFDEHRVVVGGDTFNILLISQAGGTTHHTELILEIVK